MGVRSLTWLLFGLPKYCQPGTFVSLRLPQLFPVTDVSTSDPLLLCKVPWQTKNLNKIKTMKNQRVPGQLPSIKSYAEQEPGGTGPRGRAKYETEKNHRTQQPPTLKTSEQSSNNLKETSKWPLIKRKRII